MGKRINICPRCGTRKVYSVRRSKCRCSWCKYEWNPDRLPLRLNRGEWREILNYFLLGLSSNLIAQETGIERKRVIRALCIVRGVLYEDTAKMFEGVVEVDETYVGGTYKNKRRKYRKHKAKRGRGTAKTPVFGILQRDGKIWVQVVADVKAETLIPLIEGQVEKDSTVLSDTWKAYNAVAYKGYVHKTVDHGNGEYSDCEGTHINGVEGFWGYLKRYLAAKGGIRRGKLPLYIAEFVWKYNHRNVSKKAKINRILKLLNYQALKPNYSG